MQPLLLADRESMSQYCIQRQNEILDDVGLSPAAKVRAVTKELVLQAKHSNLFKRYLTLTSDKCARCDQNACETTMHLM
jgi:hypothetical protein